MKSILGSSIALVLALTCLLSAQEIPYGVGSWDSESLGNHRVVVRVTESADAVWVHLPWRRKDMEPEKKNIVVIDSQTGKRVLNVFRAVVSRESGDLVFQAPTVPGNYYFNYMPYVSTGRSAYPKVSYQEPESTATEEWLERIGLDSFESSARPWETLPRAEVLEIQSIDELNSFYPMEVIATEAETQQIVNSTPGATYMLFPESRRYPIRMRSDLPYRWIKGGARREFRGTVSRGEFFAFQIGLFAFAQAFEDIEVAFEDLRGKSGEDVIKASSLRCFNLGGIDWKGAQFEKSCPVEQGQVRALWFGVEVPQELSPGSYSGEIEITPSGAETGRVRLILDVQDQVMADGGDAEPWRHSRLRWLDSTIGSDNELVAPYTPLRVEENTTSCLGREVTFGMLHLPSSIQSYFPPEMTFLTKNGTELLSAPIQFVMETASGGVVDLGSSASERTLTTEGAVQWETKASSDAVSLDISTRMEFDGVLEYSAVLRARKNVELRDVKLQVPIRRKLARYMMGLGYKGGKRPENFQWKWDEKKNQDSVWIGDINAGVQIGLSDENYQRPLNTNFYLLKPLNLPPSWYNEGKGGFILEERGPSTFMVTAYSGAREVKAGQELHFNFRLSVTPFKLLNTEAQWSTRFYHRYEPLQEVISKGANTINVHHATEINPYINYPFFRTEEMKAYIDEAHAEGLRVKIYHTVRELTNRAPELHALLSLDDEVFLPGPGGGPAWLQEHVEYPYIAGWFVPRLQDAALVNSGVSRWHNFYLESLNWLVQNVGIDGLYIDDLAFDRTVMKRVRKILDRNRDGALIDLHSANQFNVRDGFANSANLYLEHFPYLDRLWFGEYFDYDLPPDFWMVEVSGIPFGLMGEMLQDGGNPYRGMIYGMTSRYPWSQDPPKLWKLWDEFGIQESRMLGYWAPSCPVHTDHPEVLATVYVKEEEALVALASWAEEDVSCRLDIDWEALGIAEQKARLIAPDVGDLQSAAVFGTDDEIPVAVGKGWYFVLATN